METKKEDTVFSEDNATSWEVVGKGIKRKIMLFNESMMLVKVAFEQGGIGSLHQHVHTQISAIESGVFEVEIEGVKKVLRAGDSFLVPSNAMHGVVCMEKGVLIDVFNPMREDFVKCNVVKLK
jgi:quercetin dioxygenase-like cupin family protein